MSDSLYWPIKMVLAIVGVIGLLVVPGFVWVTGIGLDSESLTGVLVFFGFMLAISLAVPFAFLLPAMEVSRGWRIGVALVLLAYVVPVSIHSVWPLGNLLIVVEFGAAPAAVALFLLAWGLNGPGGRLRWDELSGGRLYVALVSALAIIGASIWWQVTGYRTNVGFSVGLVALVLGLVASRFLSRLHEAVASTGGTV